MASQAIELMQLSDEQVKVLEDCFKGCRYPDGTTLMLVAAECGLSEDDTLIWFKQRNAKWRKAEGLPAEHGSVLD
ncbi:homeodomain-only protein [Hippoglossus hippoglossus]|uniref:homeodomain-only protein n=1 Tax=Hippoglossus hippoglossus TaxID=8267 RepID=UPI00148D4D94|nr:homeodomain-only protein [Hippoglossus hippoglossus]XP_034454984.1 homeodomain-only protein [Hippoglossus hippoglossus]XP_035018130.1 homeodomain-only protein [Hippoglossus stenolepis]